MKKLGIVLILLCLAAFVGCDSKEAKEIYAKGVEALEVGDYELAAEEFQSLADMEEKLPEAYRGLGIALFNQEQYAESSIAFSKAVLYMETDNPKFEQDVKSYLAISRMKRGEYSKAIDVYNELMLLEDNPEYYYMRGKCYLALGKMENAKSDFDQAAANSTDGSLFIGIYQEYNNLQMNADGSAYLEQALELVAADDYYSRGLIHYYLQDYTKAKENLIQAIKYTNDTDAMLLLGKVYLSMEDVANARAMYQEHINEKDFAAKAYNGLALCDMAEGNYDSALISLQKGLEYEDEEVEQSLLFNEICVYEYQQDWDNARGKAAEYIIKYPADEAGVKENEFLAH